MPKFDGIFIRLLRRFKALPAPPRETLVVNYDRETLIVNHDRETLITNYDREILTITRP